MNYRAAIKIIDVELPKCRYCKEAMEDGPVGQRDWCDFCDDKFYDESDDDDRSVEDC